MIDAIQNYLWHFAFFLSRCYFFAVVEYNLDYFHFRMKLAEW